MLLTQAFAADVADRLRVPAVRDAVADELARRLGGALTPALSPRERKQT
jgi:hypothetical protein